MRLKQVGDIIINMDRIDYILKYGDTDNYRVHFSGGYFLINTGEYHKLLRGERIEDTQQDDIDSVNLIEDEDVSQR